MTDAAERCEEEREARRRLYGSELRHPPLVPDGLETRALGIIPPSIDAPTKTLEGWLKTVCQIMKQQPGVAAWPQLMTHAIFALEHRKRCRAELLEELRQW